MERHLDLAVTLMGWLEVDGVPFEEWYAWYPKDSGTLTPSIAARSTVASDPEPFPEILYKEVSHVGDHVIGIAKADDKWLVMLNGQCKGNHLYHGNAVRQYQALCNITRKRENERLDRLSKIEQARRYQQSNNFGIF